VPNGPDQHGPCHRRRAAGGLPDQLQRVRAEYVRDWGRHGGGAESDEPPIGGGQIGIFVVLGFALGITTVWLYAAIRPRFGPGVSTASCAALTVWFLAYVYPSMFILALHVFPTTPTCISIVWGLPEIVIAGIAGAWAYTES
jgi:hypothetical protein